MLQASCGTDDELDEEDFERLPLWRQRLLDLERDIPSHDLLKGARYPLTDANMQRSAERKVSVLHALFRVTGATQGVC